eukprot:CAMPEP_0202407508 /NCGR_PEP_ID=MMETSP1128-20130828/12362_1 /ASSEMBLY_ACC=CAM_ASM_000463 /TAXON_ID=3047 /ORGANISM="Dunaliella tertiolecta, Strain CCMP1320" /LENGTH=62 /DNA_ID=CAMNT_0049012509 /DNA_START=456 /DNA_END=644 /DNA_ORIENTATION=+
MAYTLDIMMENRFSFMVTLDSTRYISCPAMRTVAPTATHSQKLAFARHKLAREAASSPCMSK